MGPACTGLDTGRRQPAADARWAAVTQGDAGELIPQPEHGRPALCKPDAFFFYPYGIGDRDDVDYFLETFQMETGGLKPNEIKEPGEYRTKRLVLTEYDRMGCRRRESRDVEGDGRGPRRSCSLSSPSS